METNKTKDLEHEYESTKLDLKSRRKRLKRIVDVFETEVYGLCEFEETDSDESSSASDEPKSKQSKTDVKNK